MTIQSINGGFPLPGVGSNPVSSQTKGRPSLPQDEVRDKVELSSALPTPDASPSSVSSALTSAQTDRVSDLVYSLLGKQTQSFGASTGSWKFTLSINVTFDTSDFGSDTVGNGDDWGVDAVATRIMDLAVSLSGGDASKLDTLQAAVNKGFDQAANTLGGTLPDICQQTRQEITNRFDDWRENGSLDGYVMADPGTD